MAGKRADLHMILKSIMGNNMVYFQPTSNTRLHYPCIVYNRTDMDEIDADNIGYTHKVGYDLILIDENPDSEYTEQIIQLPYTSYSRFYISDGLNHDVFRIYF